MTINIKKTFKFLKDLEKHNHRHWFSLNKSQYQLLRSEFTDWVNSLAKSVGKFDEFIKTAQLENQKTVKVFRVYRDVRFSKNKTPYKTNMSALISVGDMSEGFPVYYLSIEPGGKSFVGGGIHMPDSATLKRIRTKIHQSPKTLEKIIHSKKFRNMFPKGIDTEYRLKTAPRGYDIDDPAIELLRLKTFTAGRSFSDKQVASPDFEKEVLKTFKALLDFHAYLMP